MTHDGRMPEQNPLNTGRCSLDLNQLKRKGEDFVVQKLEKKNPIIIDFPGVVHERKWFVLRNSAPGRGGIEIFGSIT